MEMDDLLYFFVDTLLILLAAVLHPYKLNANNIKAECGLFTLLYNDRGLRSKRHSIC